MMRIQSKTIQIENVVSFTKKEKRRYIRNMRTGVSHRVHPSAENRYNIMRRQQGHFPNVDVYREGDRLEIIQDFTVAMTTSEEVE